MEDLTTKVQDVVQTSMINDQRQFVPALRIDFMVGKHGPYNVIVPAAGYSAAAVKSAVEARAQEIRATFQ